MQEIKNKISVVGGPAGFPIGPV